jgi:hypothetical protein
MRTTLTITDRKHHPQELSIFSSNHQHENAVFGVVKIENSLVALDCRFAPIGYLVDPSGKLWNELQQHPAYEGKIHVDRAYDYGRVSGDAIFLDLARCEGSGRIIPIRNS